MFLMGNLLYRCRKYIRLVVSYDTLKSQPRLSTSRVCGVDVAFYSKCLGMMLVSML